MGRRARGFRHAALVDGDIHQGGAAWHGAQEFTIDQARCAAAVDVGGAHHQIGVA